MEDTPLTQAAVKGKEKAIISKMKLTTSLNFVSQSHDESKIKKINDRRFKDRISKSMISFHTGVYNDCIPNSSSLEVIKSHLREEKTENDRKVLLVEVNHENGPQMEDCIDSSVILENKSLGCKRWWFIADMFFSFFFVAPLVVCSWHGIWMIMDIYLKVFISDINMAICGLILHLSFALSKEMFQKWETTPGCLRCFPIKRFFSRLYCWLFLCSCISHWRGGWKVYPGLTEDGLTSLLIFVSSLYGLILFRSMRNLLTVPFFIGLDSTGRTYYFHTRFRKVSREPLLYFLDCLFSVVVVGSLVVFVWRGAWDLLDVYMFPLDKPMSAWTSFVLGYGIAIVTFLLQGAARRACAKLKGAKRLVVADLFLLMSFMATINVWRSIWMLLDIYFLPENPELSNWITHCGCFLLLMLLNCGNSVLVRGVYIDAEEEGGQCVVFPCYYLRLFFQKERLKKRQKKLEAIASQKGDLEGLGGEPLLTKPGTHPIIVKSATPQNHILMHETNNETAKETNGENNNENA